MPSVVSGTIRRSCRRRQTMTSRATMSPEYAADIRWVETHYSELHRKHENMWVAVVDGEVAAACPGLAQARRLAAERTGRDPDRIYAEYMCGELAVYDAR